MRIRFRTTTLALAGLLTLGGVAACSEGERDSDTVEQEGEGAGESEGESDGY